ncbi:MAG: DJ-1/PfpI family protein [Lachnospiraceae bacterium]|nr:DJ-1/PfpI family protein [Lachnospiraceae bacterium]
MKKVYAFFAEGFEEVEALMVIDLLRRTHEVEVVTASITDEIMVKSSHGFNIMADKVISDINFDDGDMIFLPGGMPGTTNLAGCKTLTEQVSKYNEEGKYLAAICAAPSILGGLGLVKGKNVTCFPGFEEQMEGANCLGTKVVTDGNIITAKGLGAALEMGLELINILVSEAKSNEIAKAIQYK